MVNLKDFTFEELKASSKEKTDLWQVKKSTIDEVLAHYDFYLTLLSKFCIR